jgi:hypothetical protein
MQEAQKHVDPLDPDPDSDPVRNTAVKTFFFYADQGRQERLFSLTSLQPLLYI